MTLAGNCVLAWEIHLTVKIPDTHNYCNQIWYEHSRIYTNNTTKIHGYIVHIRRWVGTGSKILYALYCSVLVKEIRKVRPIPATCRYEGMASGACVVIPNVLMLLLL